MSVRPRVWTLATAVVGSLATLALMEVQSLHFAYRAFGLHVALEVTASFVAFLAAARQRKGPSPWARITAVIR